MKYIKLFESFRKAEHKLDFVETQIIADAIRNGDTCASSEYHDDLEVGFELKVANYGGYMNIEQIDQKYLNIMADEIENGKLFGIVEIPAEDGNLEWNLELDV